MNVLVSGLGGSGFRVGFFNGFCFVCFVSINQVLVRVELGMEKFPEAAVNLGVSKPGILRISK